MHALALLWVTQNFKYTSIRSVQLLNPITFFPTPFPVTSQGPIERPSLGSYLPCARVFGSLSTFSAPCSHRWTHCHRPNWCSLLLYGDSRRENRTESKTDIGVPIGLKSASSIDVARSDKVYWEEIPVCIDRRRLKEQKEIQTICTCISIH